MFTVLAPLLSAAKALALLLACANETEIYWTFPDSTWAVHETAVAGGTDVVVDLHLHIMTTAVFGPCASQALAETL